MNLDKKASVYFDLTTTDLYLLLIFIFIDIVISFIFYFIFHNTLIALIIFLFFLANAIIAVKILQQLPDRYFMHLIEYLKSPKYYLPEYDNEENK